MKFPIPSPTLCDIVITSQYLVTVHCFEQLSCSSMKTKHFILPSFIPSPTIFPSLFRSKFFTYIIFSLKKIFFLRFYLFIFREGGGREKERERNINVWLPLVHPLLGTWPTTQACALTGNWTSNPLVHRPALNPLSHTSQGWRTSFNISGRTGLMVNCLSFCLPEKVFSSPSLLKANFAGYRIPGSVFWFFNP